VTERKNRFSAVLVATALASLLIGSTIAYVVFDHQQTFALDTVDARKTPEPPPQALEHATNLSGAFKHAAQVISPSVVSIRSTKVFKPQPRGDSRPQPSPDLPEEFREFFGEDFFERFGGDPFRGGSPFGLQPRGGMRQQGQGTGVIISEDGYVVTNNHVVDGADEVEVQLVDGRSFEAKVIGTDGKTDVAVLKIEASDLTPAAIGSSDAIEVGDWVVAVGSPFGLQHTVTAGIVSAKGRADVGIVEYEDFIQTDAAINPGNSGGPLVNLRGEVIGINTAIASRSGSFAGVGFSIPMKMVQSVVQDILDDGKVERGWLGAAIQDLDEDLAASFNYDSTDGVLVGQVVPNSPAERAGLKAGDIIVEFNGRKQTNANGLRNQVSRTKPGTEAPMKVYRDGRPVTLNVKVGLLDERTASRSLDDGAAPEPDESEVVSDLGMTIRTLTPALAERLDVEGQTTGVVVTQVTPATVAERAGVRAGDVILSVNGRKVENVEQFNDVAGDLDLSQGVRLHLSSDGFQRYVVLRQR